MGLLTDVATVSAILQSMSTLFLVAGAFAAVAVFSVILYRLSPLHPLSHVPGPLLSRITLLNLVYHSYKGDEATYVHKLHKVYGPLVRVAPNSVDFDSIAAIHPIYIQKGGFLKPSYYNNFDIDKHATIFSETNLTARAARAKVVLPLFSTASIKQHAVPFRESVRRYIQLFKERRDLGHVNVLDLARGTGIDAVTEYLFGIRYGGLTDPDEKSEKEVTTKGTKSGMSASALVDNFIASGRFWYLPVWLYDLADRIENFIYPNPAIAISSDIVDEYADRVLEHAEKQLQHIMVEDDKSTLANYPCRLLKAGFSRGEVRAQCKDIIFAATDTIGMNLSTVCFMLAKYPATYDKLHDEISSANISREDDIQQLPYLNYVIKEALRLSMTNPCRIPREVPERGWQYEGQFYPAGTIVSASPRDMHFSNKIFESPYEFIPERWENSTEDMQKAMMAFGLGGRQCIAKAMAMYQMYITIYEVVKGDILRGAKPTTDRIEIKEGFAAKVVGGDIRLVWE